MKYLVITTISSPNEILNSIANQSYVNNTQLIIVGDKKSPTDFKLGKALYLSIDDQRTFDKGFASVLPCNHYSRKNIGYLYAMAKKPEYIQETDDDNIPLSTFWEKPIVPELIINSSESVWFNIYRYFLEPGTLMWPRGYPLEKIQYESTLKPEKSIRLKSYIYQGLANKNPDVDAIFRLTNKLPVKFLEQKPIQLGRNVWCPFNSQNTIFYPEAFPLLYLPSTCSFRMTDIWRSFIAQRCLWEMDAGVVFHSATVYQERNEHRLLDDFEEEIPGYLGNESIKELLSKCSLGSDIYFNLLVCYEAMVKNKFFDKKELYILKEWIRLCKKLINN